MIRKKEGMIADVTNGAGLPIYLLIGLKRHIFC